MQTLKQRAEDDADREALEDRISHILEEARMVLPGIQALLGFQLVAVFNQKFSDIPKTDQYIHIAAICLSINAICFLLTPAALHRQSQPDLVTEDFARNATRFICAGMFPLLVSIVLDAYVVTNTVAANADISMIVATVLFCELIYFWVVMPQIKRRQLLGNRRASPTC